MAERKLTVKIVGDATSLNRSLTVASRSTQKFGRDFEKAERGVLAGSGVFRSLGRSLAFASGGFLAFGGAAAFVRKSIDAAKEAQVAQRQLAVQLKSNGKAFSDYRVEIDKTVNRLSALAGFQNDDLKSALTTISRTVPNVSEALNDLGTAADLARAKHISLSAAATIIAKTEAGNTTLLRRQGFQIAKNATVEQALATLRQKIAGQARAGTTEQERFGAVLHDTEEVIGGALLPTLNKYLSAGTKWLQQMNESGKLQKDVAGAAHDFEGAVSEAASAVRAVDGVTGSFKNTLEALLLLKVAGSIAGWTNQINLLGSSAARSEGEVSALRLGMSRLVGIGVITLGIEVLLNGKRIDETVGNFLDRHGLGFLGGTKESTIKLNLDPSASSKQIEGMINKLKASPFQNFTTDVFVKALTEAFRRAATREIQGTGLKNLTQGIEQNPRLGVPGSPANLGPTNADIAPRAIKLTAEQRRRFFDNQISRIMLRGGLQDIQGQIAAIDRASALITKRIATTKDVTRKLNLEDQLLQLASQRRDAQAQIVAQGNTIFDNAISRILLRGGLGNLTQQIAAIARASALISKRIAATKDVTRKLELEDQLLQLTAERRQDQAQKRQNAAAAALSKRTARQFRELGLTATGANVVPGVARLKRELGSIGDSVAGTKLDTPKLKTRLAGIRKALAEGIVPRDIRERIQAMFAEINAELKKQETNSTGFKHANSNAVLAGLGLTAEQRRALRERITRIGAGGTVPTGRSAAFTGAGAGTIVIHNTIDLDGRTVARNTTKHQQKDAKTKTKSRRG